MDENPKRANEPKNNSSVWFALIIVAVLALCLVLILRQNTKTLDYVDFKHLIEITKFDESREALVPGLENNGILQIKERGTDGRVIEYTEPTNLVVADQSIKGFVKYRIVSGPGAFEAFKPVEFTVNKDRSDPTNGELRELLIDSNTRWDYADGPNAWDRYGFFLITMALIIGLFYFMMRRLGGAGGPMQFGRSRGRLMAEEDLGVMFNDVAGIDEAVDEVKEVVDFLQKPEKYQKLGGEIPRGVLLVGPPGTGKTLLAKAIAGEAGVPFFSLSGSDFVEMFVGVGAARVRDMFQQAEAKAPCIIFIDELDALGQNPRRQCRRWSR